MLPCDVEDIASVDAVFADDRREMGQRSTSSSTPSRFSDKNELKGRYADTTRENFSRTMVISCFSFTEVAKRAAALMPDGGAMVTLTYNGGDARDAELQRHGRRQGGAGSVGALSRGRFRRAQNIRVNAISAGPIRTLAGAGIADARYMFAFQQRHSPLRRGVTLEELGGAALYLLSDLSSGVTGEIHFVDSGYNIIAMPQPGCAETRRRARTAASSGAARRRNTSR